MTSILAVVVIVLSLAHFLYETIIAPTLRLRIKFAFFGVRDRAFHAHMKQPDTFTREDYELFVESINGVMRHTSEITLSTTYMMRRRLPREVRIRATARARRFEGSESAEVREIAYDLARYVEMLLIVNNAGLFVTMVPFAVSLVFMRKALRALIFRDPDHDTEDNKRSFVAQVAR